MERSAEDHRLFQYGILFRCHKKNPVIPLAVEAARILFPDDRCRTVAFGAGLCSKASCSFPGRTLPFLEACGIDVFATVRNSHPEIHTLKRRDEIPDCFGLIVVE